MKNYGKVVLSTFLFILPLIFIGCNREIAGGNSNTSKPPDTPNSAENKPVQSPSTPTPPPAKAESNILFILDSSGSMKARAGNKTKMETAKEVLKNLVGTLPADSQVGLLAYGHRAKNDCRDTELLVPFGRLEADLFKQKVENLQPLGQTPISYSLRQAAEAFQGKTGRKSIILVSDGEETCKEDPCEVAAELKKAEIDLKVHVVGFGIDTAAAKKQLTCIAESTGGTYQDAGNAEELKKTLEGVTAQPDLSRDRGQLVTIGRNSYGQPIYQFIEFYKPGGHESAGVGTDPITPASTAVIKIQPGIYDLRYWGNGFPDVWKRNVEIKAEQETRVDLGEYGRIKFSIKDQNGNDAPMYGNVFKANETTQFSGFYKGGSPELPPGIYDVEFWDVGSQASSKGIEVKAGQETFVEVIANK